MKLLTEYLDRAIALERFAADELNLTFRDQLLNQAASYRKLAAKKVEQLARPQPTKSGALSSA